MAEDFHCCTQLCRRRARKCAVAAQSSDNCGNSAHFSLFSSLPPGLPCFPLLLTSPPPPACSEAVIASNGFLLQLPTLSLICHPLSSHRQLEIVAKLFLQINVLIIFIFIASSEVRWSGCGGGGHDITVQAQLRPQLTLAAKLSSPPSASS